MIKQLGVALASRKRQEDSDDEALSSWLSNSCSCEGPPPLELLPDSQGPRFLGSRCVFEACCIGSGA